MDIEFLVRVFQRSIEVAMFDRISATPQKVAVAAGLATGFANLLCDLLKVLPSDDLT
jgi:hypothetical protein